MPATFTRNASGGGPLSRIWLLHLHRAAISNDQHPTVCQKCCGVILATCPSAMLPAEGHVPVES
ncbi:MAG: hypothetical protein QF579_01610, partial [Dehalococcoidia bacterium]|nr:hypothetical protein [Dehalococcoidia bacterium]